MKSVTTSYFIVKFTLHRNASKRLLQKR